MRVIYRLGKIYAQGNFLCFMPLKLKNYSSFHKANEAKIAYKKGKFFPTGGGFKGFKNC